LLDTAGMSSQAKKLPLTSTLFDDETPTTQRQRLPPPELRDDEHELSQADLFLADLDDPDEVLTPEPRRVPRA
jgi:hypothetical protein